MYRGWSTRVKSAVFRNWWKLARVFIVSVTLGVFCYWSLLPIIASGLVALIYLRNTVQLNTEHWTCIHSNCQQHHHYNYAYCIYFIGACCSVRICSYVPAHQLPAYTHNLYIVAWYLKQSKQIYYNVYSCMHTCTSEWLHEKSTIYTCNNRYTDNDTNIITIEEHKLCSVDNYIQWKYELTNKLIGRGLEE